MLHEVKQWFHISLFDLIYDTRLDTEIKTSLFIKKHIKLLMSDTFYYHCALIRCDNYNYVDAITTLFMNSTKEFFIKISNDIIYVVTLQRCLIKYLSDDNFIYLYEKIEGIEPFANSNKHLNWLYYAWIINRSPAIIKFLCYKGHYHKYDSVFYKNVKYQSNINFADYYAIFDEYEKYEAFDNSLRYAFITGCIITVHIIASSGHQTIY